MAPGHGRIAIVTGAGSGIGRAIAQALAVDGWAIALAGRRPQPLHETARAIDPDASRTLVLPTDVTDAAAVGALFAAVVERWGRLDLLVNNAGIFPPALPLEEIGPDDWRAAVEVNLTGAFLCTQAAFRIMKAQTPRGGRIINNGSISAHTPRPNAAAYTATKHAMTGLTKAAALEGRAFDIAVGQIDIGNAATEMTGPMAAGVLQADGSVAPEARTDAAHAARLVALMAALPLDANVLQAMVIATAMPFVGRG
jgi:NAD(P)-dependent dehydrogenase (short-subunit alcohol dehydrogenase family)